MLEGDSVVAVEGVVVGLAVDTLVVSEGVVLFFVVIWVVAGAVVDVEEITVLLWLVTVEPGKTTVKKLAFFFEFFFYV